MKEMASIMIKRREGGEQIIQYTELLKIKFIIE
jgi:hypothetical protein